MIPLTLPWILIYVSIALNITGISVGIYVWRDGKGKKGYVFSNRIEDIELARASGEPSGKEKPETPSHGEEEFSDSDIAELQRIAEKLKH